MLFGQDDTKATEEVVSRRLRHSVENPKGAFGVLPDVIFADGAIAQVRAIRRALDKYNLDHILVFGMVKDSKHRTKALINENGEEVPSDKIINFVTLLQDEVHGVAIEYNKKLRKSNMTKSRLDEILRCW